MPRRRIKRLDPSRRNPLLSNIPALDAWIAGQLAAGVLPVQMLAQVLPSIATELAAVAARNRQDRDEKVAKRLARIAAQNDPAKREAERQRYQAKVRARARKAAARDAK